eukprot:COSAG02_NODE_3975_length_5965_cov_5.092226_7_plen_170_part_00
MTQANEQFHEEHGVHFPSFVADDGYGHDDSGALADEIRRWLLAIGVDQADIDANDAESESEDAEQAAAEPAEAAVACEGGRMACNGGHLPEQFAHLRDTDYLRRCTGIATKVVQDAGWNRRHPTVRDHLAKTVEVATPTREVLQAVLRKALPDGHTVGVTKWLDALPAQ